VMLRASTDPAHPGWFDVNFQPYTPPPGTTVRPINPTQAGGGRAGQMTLRQVIAGKEVLRELQNMVALPVGTTTGWMGGFQPKTSLIGTLSGNLSRALTDQDSAFMQVAANNLGRELATLQLPVYLNEHVTKSIDDNVPKAGNSIETSLYKLATMAQTADRAIAAIEESAQVTEEQRADLREMQAQLKQAIPWTPSDVLKFSQQGRENETFGDFIKREGIGSVPASQWPTPPPEAQQELRNNPGLREQYDKTFGPGASVRVLGQ